MIHAYSLATGLDYVEVNWTHPRFLPESYQLKYRCAVKVTSNYKAVNKIYITGRTKNLTSDSISFRIFNLRPGSTCTLILLAVYNPASIDSGVVITGNTDEQPSKRNSGLCDFIRTHLVTFHVTIPVCICTKPQSTSLRQQSLSKQVKHSW